MYSGLALEDYLDTTNKFEALMLIARDLLVQVSKRRRRLELSRTSRLLVRDVASCAQPPPVAAPASPIRTCLGLPGARLCPRVPHQITKSIRYTTSHASPALQLRLTSAATGVILWHRAVHQCL